MNQYLIVALFWALMGLLAAAAIVVFRQARNAPDSSQVVRLYRGLADKAGFGRSCRQAEPYLLRVMLGMAWIVAVVAGAAAAGFAIAAIFSN